MKAKTTNYQPDRAVSPVIGVILMVAITVILAAVIGTFVLGLGSGTQNNANAGVNVGDDGTSVTLTSLGENTNGIYCTGSDDVGPGSPGADTTKSNQATNVGDTITACGGDNVVAVTDSGKETVILTDVGN